MRNPPSPKKVTPTCEPLGNTARVAGHPSDFDDSDQEILREAMASLMARGPEFKTREAMGRPLGIKQQNVSRFLLRKGGIGRATANKLASLCGFRDAEQLITEGRAMRGLRLTGGNVWASRDSAVRMAEAVGYSSDAISTVVARHKAPEDARRDVKWWLNKIVLEDLNRRADG